MFNDLMGNITWLFTLHDNNKDGFLTKDEVLKLSESLLVSYGLVTPLLHPDVTLSACPGVRIPFQFIFRNEPGDQYLAAVSRLMQNAFEFADGEVPDSQVHADTTESSAPVSDNLIDADDRDKPLTSSRRSTITEQPTTRPFLSLATFRMVVLADELLESFFSEDLTASWHLEPLTEDPPQARASGATGRFTNFVSSLISDETQDLLGKLADDIGKRLDIQHVEQRPSLGRLTGAAALQEPQERATLLSTSKSPRTSSSTTNPTSPSPSLLSPDPFSAASMRQPVNLPPLVSTASPPITSPEAEESTATPDPSAAAVSVPRDIQQAAEMAVIQKALPDAPKDKVLGLSIMDERPRFAIDDAVEDDEELGDDDDEDLAVDDSALMNGERVFVCVIKVEERPDGHRSSR